MNVRRMSATTISLIVVIVCIFYFILEMPRAFPNDAFRVINERYLIGNYHSFIISSAIWLICIVGIIDSILKKYVAMTVVYSFFIPIVLFSIIFSITIYPVNSYIIWGIIYIVLILGIYIIFRWFIPNNYPGGIKLLQFIKQITSGVGRGSNHIIDRYTVFIISMLLVMVYALLLVSFVIYVITFRSILIETWMTTALTCAKTLAVI